MSEDQLLEAAQHLSELTGIPYCEALKAVNNVFNSFNMVK